ncbi:MAG: toll/interleukin-1 receptor domain-containing protein [Verrucomicrobia bacterium]|nr:toll/interleukin-1 receptor domain-containing protein [Verrucomicrobiota bacterium]
MTDHQIQKPNLFISHASSDGEFANVLKAEIEKVFADGIKVFSSSSPGAIGASNDWLQTIENRLGVAQAVIAIVTPLSIERPWLWFEVGASWLRARSNQLSIYPLCASEINFSELPSPLDRLQALSMGKSTDLKLLFEGLIRQFGFGKISSFKASNIIKRLPKYASVKIADVDLNDRHLYSGKYAGYTDEELVEVLNTEFLGEEIHGFVNYPSLHTSRESSLYRGKLVHFRQIDKSLDLPPGTCRRLLIPAAEPFGLEPELLRDNIVRFQSTKWFRDKYMKDE